jgi:hypothetical protein
LRKSLFTELKGLTWKTMDNLTLEQLTTENISQIFELTSGIHCLKKAMGVNSLLRRLEVDKLSVNSYQEYCELLKKGVENVNIEVLELEKAPPMYKDLEKQGILPPWPGRGIVYKTMCAPSNRSVTDKKAWKYPHILIFDDAKQNLLNCSEKFKNVGAMFCMNCPSTNGGVSTCCHLAYLILHLFAKNTLIKTVCKPVQVVNIKNKFEFLEPDEVMEHVESTVEIPYNLERRSLNSRRNDQFLFPSKSIKLNTKYEDVNPISMNVTSEQEVQNEEFNITEMMELIHTEIEDVNTVEDTLQVEETKMTVNMNKTLKHENIAKGHKMLPVNENDENETVFNVKSTSTTSTFRGAAKIEMFITKKLKKMEKKDVDLVIPAINNNRGILFILLC